MNELERSYEVIKRIKRLKEGMHSNLERIFKDMNLTGPQGIVVGTLFKFGPMKISEIATQIGLSMSTVSGILDRLEKTSVIYRQKSENDGRVIMVDLTETFRAASSETFCKIEADYGKKLNRATKEEIEAILYGLEILEKLLVNDLENDKRQGDTND